MLDPNTIDRFAYGFFGYGNLQAPIWFIGMEEGGLRDVDDFERRVNAWTKLDRTPLVDIVEFSRDIGAQSWFEPDAQLQRTWRALIRTVLIATNADVSVESQRAYQTSRLGRRSGETALLELLPFPSASTRDWPYAPLGIEKYATRGQYQRALTDPRREAIFDLIETHQPRAVVCYGRARFWEKHLPLQPGVEGVRACRRGATLFIATSHPTAFGSTNERWDSIGMMIREHLAGIK